MRAPRYRNRLVPAPCASINGGFRLVAGLARPWMGRRPAQKTCDIRVRAIPTLVKVDEPPRPEAFNPVRPTRAARANCPKLRISSVALRRAIATLTLDVQEDGGLRPGYQLKLNSYDLSVDIELADAVERLRFEHPEVKAVVITSGKDRIFSAGANIYMLASSSHNFKVNLPKGIRKLLNWAIPVCIKTSMIPKISRPVKPQS